MGGGILWQKKLLGPGPTKLIGGNESAGFYGEVSAEELITGDELAKRIGLTAGTSQYSNEPWLKFSYMGNTEFVAKKPFRHSISWDNINAVNAVFGNRTIEIGESEYKIRLLKGKTEGKQNDTTSFEGSINHNSEWNKLMLPISENAPTNWGKYFSKNVLSPTEDWNVDYSEFDLGVQWSQANGTNSWCQEYGRSDGRLTRGGSGTASSSYFYAYDIKIDTGWRPVLELIGNINNAQKSKDYLQIQFGNGSWFNGDGVAPNIGKDIRTMPTTIDGYKTNISWKSSNPGIITDDGKRVGKGNVSLIATIRDTNGNIETKEFKLIVI